MKRIILKMFLMCICLVVLFCSNTAFATDWEQWRITHDGQDNSGRDEERADRLQRAAEWRTEQAEERAKQSAEQEKQKEEKRKAEAYSLNEQGNAAWQNNDWDAAVGYYSKAVKLSSNDNIMQQNLKYAQDRQWGLIEAGGMNAYYGGAWERAIERFKEALRLRPDNNVMRENLKNAQNSLASEKKKTELTAKLNVKIEAEQKQLDNNPAAWTKNEKELIQQRRKEPNRVCSGIYTSLMGKVPPLPDKKFNELQPGDVLLLGGSRAITTVDNLLSGDKVSYSSHTISYLKEVKGKKLFLDNQPGQGPRIISEDYFLKKYGSRETEVARLVGQPLNEKEAKQLFTAAVEMAQKNRKEIADKLLSTTVFGFTLFGTNYGVWGKDDVVCSEADWILLKTAGREIPRSSDKVKVNLGIDFSPADYRNQQYFLVTPLEMPKSVKEKDEQNK